MTNICTPGGRAAPDSEAGQTFEKNRLLTVREAAKLCGCSCRHFVRLAAEGLAPRGVKLRQLRRWNAAEMARWIEAGCPAVGGRR
jgi:excisionase family DNA binding protein